VQNLKPDVPIRISTDEVAPATTSFALPVIAPGARLSANSKVSNDGFARI
jgi:hypothetical protein